MLILGGILLAFLAVPALGSVISEFRPDLSWGLLIGFTGMLLLLTNLLNAKSSTLILLGLLIGLDLVAKPTGAVPVVAVLGTAYCVSIIASLYERRCGLKGLAYVTLVIAIGTGIIVIPYFAVAGREIIAYVRAVMIEDAGIWQPVESTATHLLYYGRLARMAMGWLWPTGFVFLGCQGVWLVIRDKSFSPDLVRFLGVIL